MATGRAVDTFSRPYLLPHYNPRKLCHDSNTHEYRDKPNSDSTPIARSSFRMLWLCHGSPPYAVRRRMDRRLPAKGKPSVAEQRWVLSVEQVTRHGRAPPLPGLGGNGGAVLVGVTCRPACLAVGSLHAGVSVTAPHVLHVNSTCPGRGPRACAASHQQ